MANTAMALGFGLRGAREPNPGGQKTSLQSSSTYRY
jgi:hypothetical protein